MQRTQWYGQVGDEGKFVGISKKRWIGANLKMEEGNPALICLHSLQQMAQQAIASKHENGKLPPQVIGLEEFVRSVYGA